MPSLPESRNRARLTLALGAIALLMENQKALNLSELFSAKNISSSTDEAILVEAPKRTWQRAFMKEVEKYNLVKNTGKDAWKILETPNTGSIIKCILENYYNGDGILLSSLVFPGSGVSFVEEIKAYNAELYSANTSLATFPTEVLEETIDSGLQSLLDLINKNTVNVGKAMVEGFAMIASNQTELRESLKVITQSNDELAGMVSNLEKEINGTKKRISDLESRLGEVVKLANAAIVKTNNPNLKEELTAIIKSAMEASAKPLRESIELFTMEVSDQLNNAKHNAVISDRMDVVATILKDLRHA